MAIKFEQDPTPGTTPELNDPLQAELLEAFIRTNDFATQHGIFDTMGVYETLTPEYWEHRSPGGKRTFAFVGTEFESRRKGSDSLDSISLEMEASQHFLRNAEGIIIMVKTNCLFHPHEDREVIYANASHCLDENGQIVSQSVGIVHTVPGTTPMEEEVDKGFDIEYTAGEEPIFGGDRTMEAMTHSFIRKNLTDQECDINSFPLDVSHLILSGQIIPLLEMIASTK